MSTVTVPNIGWFSEGNFFWLDIDLWGDYHEIPVVYDEEGLNQGWGCPEEIIVNEGYKFVQYYENDNVYQKYQFGKETGEFYSLLDIEGNGYYTGLIGSPCMFGVILFTYNDTPVIAYPIWSYFVESIFGSYPDIRVSGVHLPENFLLSSALVTLYKNNEYDKMASVIRSANYGSTCTITPTGGEAFIPVKFDKMVYYDDEGVEKEYATWETSAGEVFIYAGAALTYVETLSVTVKAYLGDITISGNEVVQVALEDPGSEGPYTTIKFTGQGTDTTYDLEEAPENYKVLGTVGNTVTIQIDDHKTVTHTYENQVGEVTIDPSGDTIIVTATTKSDPSDVTCQLYQCSADPRVVDKTDYLTNIQQLSGSWVVPFDEMSPVLRINLSNNLVTSGNYCSIYSAGWGTKYYFIKNRVCVGQEVWDLYLEEDVLMTFKSYFKTATGLIDRSESAYNLLIPDSTIPLEVGQNVTVREITNDVFSDNYGYNYVLTGLLVGGETK